VVPGRSGRGRNGPREEGLGARGQDPEGPVRRPPCRHRRLEHGQPVGVQGPGIAEGGQGLSPGEIELRVIGVPGQSRLEVSQRLTRVPPPEQEAGV
jgi:hypothetical protein